jgi:hypothetical protein
MAENGFELLEALHRGGSYAYWWTMPGRKSHWFEIGDSAEVPDAGKFDIYVGVHPVVSRGKASERSKTETIQCVNCLYAEFDFSDFPGETEDKQAMACRQHIQDLKLEPSAMVASGGGYHVYWLLSDTWRLEDDKARENARKLQATWVRHVGGDGGAKDLARVLRVPGTLNHKYDEPRPVEIVSWHPERRYSPKDLLKLTQGSSNGRPLEGRPTGATNVQGRQPIPDGEKLTGDDRGPYLLSIAGYLWRRWNLAPEALNAMMTAMNEIQCSPPVNEERLERIIKQIVKYDRNEAGFNMTLAMWEAVFEFLDYKFRRNLAGQVLEVNGEPVDDYERAEILMKTMLAMPAGVGEIERAYMTVAKADSYHEIVERLETLKWDGRDHILRLCGFIDYDDPPGYPAGWLVVALTRWLVGCVAKAYSQMPGSKEGFAGVQTFMLVFDGPQGIGKSHLVSELSAPFGAKYFIEGPLVADDKDTRVRLLSNFIWEVSELGATIRKQDIEALKALISQKRVKVRRAYGRYDMEGPVLCSLLGTVNNSAGLLSDPTGNRRYAIVNIKSIDWSYSDDFDMTQLWAQAVDHYKQGMSWNLDPGEVQMRDAMNELYIVDDPVQAAILECFKITNDPSNWVLSRVVLETLKGRGNVKMGTDRSLAMAIANAMTRLGVGPTRTMQIECDQQRYYFGIRCRF